MKNEAKAEKESSEMPISLGVLYSNNPPGEWDADLDMKGAATLKKEKNLKNSLHFVNKKTLKSTDSSAIQTHVSMSLLWFVQDMDEEKEKAKNTVKRRGEWGMTRPARCLCWRWVTSGRSSWIILSWFGRVHLFLAFKFSFLTLTSPDGVCDCLCTNTTNKVRKHVGASEWR